MKHPIHRLFEHLRWADDQILGALKATAEPPTETIRLYAHLLAAETIWLDRIEGQKDSVAVWPTLTVDECSVQSEEARRRYADFLTGLSTERLAEAVPYANSAGQRFATPVEDILLHVALHGAYHRGQIARGLREAGLTPPSTDYIGWVRGAPPPPQKKQQEPG